MIRQMMFVAFCFLALGCEEQIQPEDKQLLEKLQQEVWDGDAETILPYVLDRDAKKLIRQDAEGKAIWSKTFKEYIGGVRDPHLVWDKEQVYFTHNRGVTALDGETGKIHWHTESVADGLLLSSNLLLGTGRVKGKGDTYVPWLYACDNRTGAIVFKNQLPEEMSDPKPVREIAGLFVIQDYGFAAEGKTLLVDRSGKVRHQFNHEVVTCKRMAENLLVLTDQNAICVTKQSKNIWAIPFDRKLDGGNFVVLEEGDLIAFRFGHIHNSGVELIRFDPSNGKVKWKHTCYPLDVGHSEYVHEADAKVIGEKLRVTSKASGGVFLEELSLQSGRQLKRVVALSK